MVTEAPGREAEAGPRPRCEGQRTPSLGPPRGCSSRARPAPVAREAPPARHPRPRGDQDGSRLWDERGSGVPASRRCVGDIGRAFATEKLRVKGSDRGKNPFFFLPREPQV